MKTKYYSDYYVNNPEIPKIYGKRIHNKLIGIDDDTALCIFNKKCYLCNAKDLYRSYTKYKDIINITFFNNKIYMSTNNTDTLIHFIHVKRIKNITPYLKYIIKD